MEIIGWLGSVLTFTAYSMKTMLPLRVVAICANLSFAYYGFAAEVWQMLALHVCLLPFNVYRLAQILVLRYRITRERQSGQTDFAVLTAYGKRVDVAAGETIFAKGDVPDQMYYIEEGEVLIDEVGVTLGPGKIFGEIAFFTDSQARMASAIAQTDCRLRALDDKGFIKLYFQDPVFGVAVMKTITRRLARNLKAHREADKPEAK